MDDLERDPFERELHDVLTSERRALPTTLVPMNRVYAGATRRRRRRVIGVAAAAAVVVAAVAVPIGFGSLGASPEPGPIATKGPPPDTTSAPPSPSFDGLSWSGAGVSSVTTTSTRTLVVLGRKAPCASEEYCLRLAESHDGGATWSALTPPSDATAVDDIEGVRAGNAAYVRFGSANDGWLFGGGLWSSHDGGHRWQSVDIPGEVYRLESAAGTVWALVANGPKEQLYRASVDGDDWVPVPGVTIRGPGDLAVQGKRVVVLGTGKSAWTNAGGSFAEVDNPCGTAVDVRLSGLSGLWGTCITGTAAFLTTSDDGVSWSKVPTPLDIGALPNSVVVGARTDREAIVALGPDQPLQRLIADDPFRPVTSPPTTGVGTGYIGFTTADLGYAIVAGNLWRTDDGGDTWTRLHIG